MSRVSEGLHDKGIVKLNGAPGAVSATGLLNDATASVQDDVATIAAQVNLIVDALRDAGILKSNNSNG